MYGMVSQIFLKPEPAIGSLFFGGGRGLKIWPCYRKNGLKLGFSLFIRILVQNFFL